MTHSSRVESPCAKLSFVNRFLKCAQTGYTQRQKKIPIQGELHRTQQSIGDPPPESDIPKGQQSQDIPRIQQMIQQMQQVQRDPPKRLADSTGRPLDTPAHTLLLSFALLGRRSQNHIIRIYLLIHCIRSFLPTIKNFAEKLSESSARLVSAAYIILSAFNSLKVSFTR